ncbi:7-cyano-7-deazaguanine synthase [Verrucomicrobia bacterium]|nr:7-cyano-7-deazaguanine synthase [Verrucomicrobiota bacterium]
MKKKVVVLVSGGMDSVSALYEANTAHQVVGALSFDYGSKHNHKEIPLAALHCQRLGIPHRIIPLDFVGQLFKSDLLKSGGAVPEGHYEEGKMKQTVVPFRNGIMLSIAGGFAESIEAQALVIAAHAGDHAIYPDCREDFMRAIADAIGLGTYAHIEILRPFIHCTKAEIARRGHELGVDFAKTWSCYKGGAIHCGACGTCVERREAFLLAGLTDPTVYADTSPLPAKPLTPAQA